MFGYTFKRNSVLLACCANAVCVGFLYSLALFAEDLRKTFLFTRSEVSIISECSYFAAVMGQLPAGFMFDLFGSRWVGVVGIVVYALAQASVYLLVRFACPIGFGWVLAAYAIMGLASASNFVAVLRIIGEWLGPGSRLKHWCKAIVTMMYSVSAIAVALMYRYTGREGKDRLEVTQLGFAIASGVTALFSAFILREIDLTEEDEREIYGRHVREEWSRFEGDPESRQQANASSATQSSSSSSSTANGTRQVPTLSLPSYGLDTSSEPVHNPRSLPMRSPRIGAASDEERSPRTIQELYLGDTDDDDEGDSSKDGSDEEGRVEEGGAKDTDGGKKGAERDEGGEDGVDGPWCCAWSTWCIGKKKKKNKKNKGRARGMAGGGDEGAVDAYVPPSGLEMLRVASKECVPRYFAKWRRLLSRPRTWAFVAFTFSINGITISSYYNLENMATTTIPPSPSSSPSSGGIDDPVETGGLYIVIFLACQLLGSAVAELASLRLAKLEKGSRHSILSYSIASVLAVACLVYFMLDVDHLYGIVPFLGFSHGAFYVIVSDYCRWEKNTAAETTPAFGQRWGLMCLAMAVGPFVFDSISEALYNRFEERNQESCFGHDCYAYFFLACGGVLVVTCASCAMLLFLLGRVGGRRGRDADAALDDRGRQAQGDW